MLPLLPRNHHRQRASRPPVSEVVWLAGIAAAPGLFAGATTAARSPVPARRQILDRPNARSSHLLATPRGGGIAVIASVALAWTTLAWAGEAPSGAFAIALGAIFLAGVSWIDDLRGLSP